MKQQSIANVRKVFDTKVNEPMCMIELKNIGGLFGDNSTQSLWVSKRIWEEMGQVMEWKQEKSK